MAAGHPESTTMPRPTGEAGAARALTAFFTAPSSLPTTNGVADWQADAAPPPKVLCNEVSMTSESWLDDEMFTAERRITPPPEFPTLRPYLLMPATCRTRKTAG